MALFKPTVAQSLAAEFRPIDLVVDRLAGDSRCIALAAEGIWEPITVTTNAEQAAEILLGAITGVLQLRLIAKSAGRVR